MQVSEKTAENSKQLSQQARPGIEPCTSRQPVLSAEPRSHWWSQGRTALTSMPYPGFEPGTFGAAAGKITNGIKPMSYIIYTHNVEF